tara:strand:- start:79 stop:684 length:606 start_codon:yes stop_codon:yes gene_type:complete
MKIVIILFWIATTINAATFKFKDGTIVKGNIHENCVGLGNPTPEGIVLKVNGKFYVHNYPFKSKIINKIIDHGDGRYTYAEEEEPVPAPAPPHSGSMNPPSLPKCLPARINFIHFSNETLNDLYKYYGNKTRYYHKISVQYPNNLNYKISFRENKNIALGIYKAAQKKDFKLNSKKLNSSWNMKVKREYGKNSSLITWFGN